jgi:hypothetical protein
MRYRDAESPEQYLAFVIEHWESYKHHNGGMCRAIKEVLEKLERLERERKKDHDEL